MYKPNDPHPASTQHRARRLAVVAGVAVAVVAAAVLQPQVQALAAGRVDRNTQDDVPPAAATGKKASATYQLRCWQYGRLLFDEGPVTLTAEARQKAKVVAFDRSGAALIVTEAGGTTCMARPFSAVEPSLALPR